MTLVKIVLASQHRRQWNKCLSRYVDDWKYRLGLESAHTALCKWATRTHQICLSETCQTSRNNKKLSKNGFWLWLSIVWETHKLTRNQGEEFSYLTNALCKWATHTHQICLSETRQTSRNNKKLSKNGFWLWLSIVWETHKLTRYQSEEFSYLNAKVYAYKREQISLLFIQIAKLKRFSTLKNSPFQLTQGLGV